MFFDYFMSPTLPWFVHFNNANCLSRQTPPHRPRPVVSPRRPSRYLRRCRRAPPNSPTAASIHPATLSSPAALTPPPPNSPFPSTTAARPVRHHLSRNGSTPWADPAVAHSLLTHSSPPPSLPTPRRRTTRRSSTPPPVTQAFVRRYCSRMARTPPSRRRCRRVSGPAPGTLMPRSRNFPPKLEVFNITSHPSTHPRCPDEKVTEICRDFDEISGFSSDPRTSDWLIDWLID